MANEFDPKQLFEEAASNAALKNQKALDDPFKKGSSVISAKQLNADKFLTYDSKTYGKLGFDPFKNNDKLYNSKTHWSEDIGRAWDGMWKLAGVGFQDTFGFGLMAEKDNWKNFDDVMQNYSSTRKGYTKFWSNTMLSSGYTIGIIGAIAAEEMALAATTAGLGVLGSAGMVGAQLGKAFTKLEKVGQSSKLLDRVSELGRIDDAAKWYSTAGLKGLGGKAISGLNPIGESMNFLTDLNKMDNLTSLQKLSTGAGAIARDMRKIYMTHSESNLEAEMARNEYVQKQFEAAYKNSGGQPLDDQTVARISLDGDNVFKSTYNGNLGLIYATNAITFDNMFKSMRFNAKMFDLPKNIFQVSRNAAGKVSVNVSKNAFKTGLKQIPRALGTYGKKKLNELTVGNIIKGTLSSSMEGVQELGQDIISNSVKSYYGRNYAGQQVRGGYMDYLYHDVGNAIKGTMNSEGASTFFSGFLMGGFAAPVSEAIRITQNELLGGGAKSKAQYLFDRQKWASSQKTKYKEALAKAKVLSEVLDTNLAYLDHVTNPMFTQTEIQEEMLSAAQDGDKKKFEDGKHESLQQGIHTMLRNNMEGQYASFLDEMSTKYTAEQLNQALGRTDITEDNINEHRATIAEKATAIRNYRKLYDEIEDTLVNPVKQSEIDQLDITDPKQKQQKLALLIRQKAFDNLKSELLFSRGKIINKAKRMEELVRTLNADSELSSTEVQSLISRSGIKTEMQLLEATVNANKALNLTGAQAEDAKKAEDKLEKLKAYQAAVSKLDAVQNDENATGAQLEEAHDELFDAYHAYRSISADYVKGESEQIKLNASKKSFAVLFDYLTLDKESDKLQEVVNTLLDPNSAADWLIKNQEMLAELDKNKETHIANQLIAYTQKAESSIMLTELQKNNLFFDLNELDDLVNKRIMPSVIYNVETGKPVTGEELKLAQEIIGSFIKNLTGKAIVGSKASANEKVSARSKNDKRTIKGLTRQYNIKLESVLDLSDPKVLEKLIAKLEASQQLTFIEKEILRVVSDSAPKIMFTDSAELPISINEDGVYVIDIRYAASEYKNAQVSFETLVLTALTQYKAAENLKNNAQIRDEVEVLMQQAKEAFAAKYQGSDAMEMFNDPAAFLSEALNNTAVQNFLAGVADTTSPAKKSLWTSLVSKLTMLFKKTFDQTLLQRAVDLAKLTLDESAIENISELVTDVEEVTLTEDVGELDEELIPTEQEDIDEALEETSREAEAEALQNKINDKLNLLNAIDAQLAALGKLSFRKRISLNNKRLALMDDINRLQEEYDTEYAYEEPVLDENDLAQIPTVETEIILDEANNVVITDKTPFIALPADLQEIILAFHRNAASITELGELRDYYRKDINKLELGYLAAHSTINGPVDQKIKDKWDADFADLNENLGRGFTARMVNGKVNIEAEGKTGDLTDQEILEIQNAMATDSDYTDLIIQYNREKEQPDLYVEPVVELDEETIRQMNADEIEKGKLLAQNRLAQQKADARARRKARRAAIVPISKMERDSIVELLRKVLKADFDVLTQADVKKLVGMLMSDSKLSPFKIPDVIAFVNQKKLKGAKKANRQLADMIAEDGGQQLTIDDGVRYGNIDKMLTNVSEGKSMPATYNGKPVVLKLSKTELELLLTYHPDLFNALFTGELYDALYKQKKVIDASAKRYRTSPLNTESPEALEESIIDLFLQVEKSGMLFPSTVKALNNNFIKAGSKLTIVKSKNGINGVYKLEARDRKLNAQPVTSYKSNLQTVKDYIGQELPGDVMAEAILAAWFAASKNNRLNPDFITRNLARGQGEIKIKKNLLSSKSLIRTSDGLGDMLKGDYSEILGEDFNWTEAINNFVNKYDTLKAMMAGVAADIKSEQPQSDEDGSEYEEQARYNAEKEEREQAQSAEDWSNFVDSGYGEVLAQANAEYYKSLEYKLENGIADLSSLDYDSLTENQKRLYEKAVEEGLYDPEDAEAANDRSNQDDAGPEESFEEILRQQKLRETNIDKKITEMLSEIPNYLDSFEVIARFKAMINESKNFDNHALFFAIYNYVRTVQTFSQEQKKLINEQLERKLNQGMYVGKSVVLNDTALQIVSYNKNAKTVELVDLSTGELFVVPYSEFLNAQDVLAEGQEFTKLNVDTVVNEQEIDYIKTTYQDIFNNFTASTLEFDKLDAEDINTQLLEQLTKCK